MSTWIKILATRQRARENRMALSPYFYRHEKPLFSLITTLLSGLGIGLIVYCALVLTGHEVPLRISTFNLFAGTVLFPFFMWWSHEKRAYLRFMAELTSSHPDVSGFRSDPVVSFYSELTKKNRTQ